MKQILLLIIGLVILPISLAFFFTLMNWFISLIPGTGNFMDIQLSPIWAIWGFLIVGIMIFLFLISDEEGWWDTKSNTR